MLKYKRYFIILLFVFLLFSSIFACKKEEGDKNIYIDIIETDSPGIQNQWAITRYDLLKLREEPEELSKIANHLPLGALVEIIRKDNELKVFNNQYDYWYYINYKGEVGWMFGIYLEIFNTQEEAIRRSEQLLFGIQ